MDLSVPQLERGQINDLWRTVLMVVELAIRLAAKNDGVAVRVDVRDRLILIWNSRIADRLANVSMISRKTNDMWRY